MCTIVPVHVVDYLILNRRIFEDEITGFLQTPLGSIPSGLVPSHASSRSVGPLTLRRIIFPLHPGPAIIMDDKRWISRVEESPHLNEEQ